MSGGVGVARVEAAGHRFQSSEGIIHMYPTSLNLTSLDITYYIKGRYTYSLIIPVILGLFI